jgi:hypothetical protein
LDDKQVVEKETWNQFMADVVPLLSFSRYCWRSNEHFTANVLVSNFSDKTLTKRVLWKLTDTNGHEIKTGIMAPAHLIQGHINHLGAIDIPLSAFNQPVRLNLTIRIDSTTFSNSYPMWVYPVIQEVNTVPLMISTLLNKAVMNELERGGRVLLMPQASVILNNSYPGLYAPDFWNFGMFRSISITNHKPVSPGTLGLLIDDTHPLFKSFPTENHSNWQWWSIVNNSRSWRISQLDSTYFPIVQVIDNMERNEKLALIAEFKVGPANGKLMVCTSRLYEQLDKPEVMQLYVSILNYMKSDKFNPSYVISEETLKQLISYTVTRSVQ